MDNLQSFRNAQKTSVNPKDFRLHHLMSNKTVNPDYTGIEMADDIVLAINIDKENDKIGNYAVVELGITGINISLNPQTQEVNFLRQGAVTIKTGVQRSFSVEGARYIGDPFQDFCLSTVYGTGEDVIVDYVLFNIITGKGEKGKVTISVESDRGGEAGNLSTFSITLSKANIAPTEYTWKDDTTASREI